MNLTVQGIENKLIKQSIKISGSKSESNRLLVLQELFSNMKIDNVSDSDDSHHMQEALASNKEERNIGHAGTTMRFLTAYFASRNQGTVVLSGSDRMHNRPIQILVEALQDLGAHIEYVEKEGYPPLKITGGGIDKDEVHIQGNVSSQYISALLLMAPSLPNGLTIHLVGEITSIPYLQMTLTLMNQVGIDTSFEGQTIKVEPTKSIENKEIVVESDWSSASYFYSIAALSKIGSEINLSAYKKNSLQGDSVLAEIYQHFGVETSFSENTITLKKVSEANNSLLELDLIKAPDIAQTIAVNCFALKVPCNLSGLHTLKIKETDRLVALENELSKLGADISVTDKSLHLKVSNTINRNVTIATYNDHRMAMAFAPLGMLVPIVIEDANVVTKSYRNFWEDLRSVGFQY